MTEERMLRDVLDIVDHAYAGVEDPSRWRSALTSLVTLVDARAAGVRVETPSGVRQEWVGLDASFDRAYVEHYWRTDPWAMKVWEAPVGGFAHGEALCARSLVEASPYHNELALVNGFDDLAGGVLERTSMRAVTIGVMKGKGSARFDDETDRRALLALPHFARALALRDRLQPEPQRDANVPRALPSAVLLTPAASRLIEGRLRLDHALTATEARVAVRIGCGMSPKEIAQELGSSWYTVRSQLRQIFTKTGKRSQSSLARLVTLLESELARAQALSRH